MKVPMNSSRSTMILIRIMVIIFIILLPLAAFFKALIMSFVEFYQVFRHTIRYNFGIYRDGWNGMRDETLIEQIRREHIND